MLYVQLPSALRAQWGLRSNPSLKGTQIDVTGALTAYFSHAGLKNTTSIVAAGGTEPTPDPDPEPGNGRSEEHTSELTSLMRTPYAVFSLKKINTTNNIT